jgi:hypothetical protein
MRQLQLALFWRLDRHMGAWGTEPPGPSYPLGAAVIAKITIGELMSR